MSHGTLKHRCIFSLWKSRHRNKRTLALPINRSLITLQSIDSIRWSHWNVSFLRSVLHSASFAYCFLLYTFLSSEILANEMDVLGIKVASSNKVKFTPPLLFHTFIIKYKGTCFPIWFFILFYPWLILAISDSAVILSCFLNSFKCLHF